MPLTFRIDPELDLVITDGSGDVDEAELFGHVKALTATPDRPRRELADFSRQTCVSVSPQTVRDAAWRLAELEGPRAGAMLALVAASDTVYAMCRMFQAHRTQEGLEVKVFRERQGALAWLGITADVGPVH